MADFTLENDLLRVKAQSLGAELTSIYAKKNQIEHLWQADPDIWGSHSPVLFPIVGRLKNDSYQFEGKTYAMSQHGFARKMEFEAQQPSENQLLFTLTDNEATRKQYPFAFELQIAYELDGKSLNVSYQVTNPGEDTLWFTIGGHPGFNCALHAGEQRSDYKLKFARPEQLVRHYIHEGLYNGSTDPVLTGGQTIPITDDLFDDDALVFKSTVSDKVSLLNKADEPEITVLYAGFPYIGFWSQAAVPGVPPYVCIEPWYGLADTTEGPVDFTQKEGMRSLAPSNRFGAAFAIRVDNA